MQESLDFGGAAAEGPGYVAAYAQLRFASATETDLYAAEVLHLHHDSTYHTMAIPRRASTRGRGGAARHEPRHYR